MDEIRYDILIPVEMYSAVGFYGKSRRSSSINAEKAFALLSWQASFHDAPSGDRYLIVHTNCIEGEARDAVEKIISMLPFVAVFLDTGLRVTTSQIKVSNGDVDIHKICIFKSGAGHRPYGMSGDLKTSVSSEKLTEAFLGISAIPENFRLAAEVFSDVDFESSTTSRIVLVTTALELICSRRCRDHEALTLIAAWKKGAQEANRGDIARALDLMREESIASAIRNEIKAACTLASLEKERAKHIEKRVIALYSKRSAVVHRGARVSSDEVAELRHYVRFLLTGTLKPGAFSGLVEGIEREKHSN